MISYRGDSARAVRDGEHSRPRGGICFVLDYDDRGSGAPGRVRLDDHDNGPVVVPGLSGLNTRS